MGILAVTSMILAAVMAERREFEQRKDEFISMAGHELKTPLTSLQGYIELLHMKFAQQGNQETLSYLAKMATQINKLSKLITDLLDLSKMQAGIPPGSKVYLIHFDKPLKHARHYLGYSKNDVRGRVQKHRTGNGARLMEAARKNGISWHVSRIWEGDYELEHILKRQHNARHLCPTCIQEKIFERYFRVYSGKDRTYPGLGIGLYIAYQIIERHSGKMWVESCEGQGSTFSFSLPFVGKA